MKRLLMLAVLAAPAAAQEPLRPMSECLDPDRARAWHLVDSDEILVDAGRRKYHLDLQPSCPELGFAVSIGFRSGDGVGRICGSPGDRVVFERRSPVHVPCRITRVTPLTDEEYRERVQDRPARGQVEVREDAAQR